MCRFYERGDTWTLYIYMIKLNTWGDQWCFPLASLAVCDPTRYTIKQRCTTIYRTGFAVDVVVEHLTVRAILC